MIEKAKTLPADEVFLDLEDAVAPDAKAAGPQPGGRRAGRARLGRAAARGAGQRLDDAVDATPTSSRWCPRAGASLDVVVLPKVTDVSHVQALDLLLTQLETAHGLPVGGIGIEAQIENAQGLTNIDAIAAGPRVQALVLGPADLMASLNMRTLGRRRAARGLRRRRRATTTC